MIDFPTALARLLRDGPLRDHFADDPEKALEDLELAEADRQALLVLNSGELEHQADILLHKRFDLVRPFLPQTCAGLPVGGWLAFKSYARKFWPKGEDIAVEDAVEFCDSLASAEVDPAERNRLFFVYRGLVFRCCVVHGLEFGGRKRFGLQVLYRIGGKSREIWLGIGL